MPELNDVVNEIADMCYVDQLRSDAAFHKKRDIKNILLKLKGAVIDEAGRRIRDLERRLYIAEKAVADNEL